MKNDLRFFEGHVDEYCSTIEEVKEDLDYITKNYLNNSTSNKEPIYIIIDDIHILTGYNENKESKMLINNINKNLMSILQVGKLDGISVITSTPMIARDIISPLYKAMANTHIQFGYPNIYNNLFISSPYEYMTRNLDNRECVISNTTVQRVLVPIINQEIVETLLTE